ncbi:MAG TPA: tetratricopeptide repeat protein, partial [Bacteroidales bacterium]|nr:tetratricopeptide repeat protein [Bacteroidales bacterium]
LCFFFSVLLSSVPVSAQPVSKNSPAGIRFEQLDSLVNALWISDNVHARRYALQAYSLSLQTGSLQKIIRAHYLRALTIQTTYSDSSYYLLNRALTLSNTYRYGEEKAGIFYSLSSLYMTAGEMRSALNCLDSATASAKRYHQAAILDRVYNSRGNVCLESSDSMGAIKMFQQAYRLGEEKQDYTIMGVARGNLAQFEKTPGDNAKGLHAAIYLLQQIKGNEDEIAQFYANLGMNESDPVKALAYYNQALTLGRKGGMPVTLIGTMNNMAYSLLETNRADSAETCVKQAIDLATRIDNHFWLAILYDTYSDILTYRHRTAEAVVAMKSALAERALDENRKSLIQVRLLSAMMDTRDKEEALIKSSK